MNPGLHLIICLPGFELAGEAALSTHTDNVNYRYYTLMITKVD